MKLKIEKKKNVLLEKNLSFRTMARHYFFFIFILLNTLSYNLLWAQTFIQYDFDELIKNHPLMKKYDKKTGYFKGTGYDKKYDVNKLLDENQILKNELKELDVKIKENEEKFLSDNEENWQLITDLNKRKSELKEKIDKNINIIAEEGEPEILKLVNIIDTITEDSLLPLYNVDKIILNKLPKYTSKIPFNSTNNLRQYYYTFDKNKLTEYLKDSYAISLMFNNSNNTILFNNPNSNTGKIALVDFAKILSLHPKMSLFDFSKLGFYKLDKYNLSENEFENEIIKINNEITQLEDTKKILNDVEKEILSSIDKYAKDMNYDVVINVATPIIHDSFEQYFDNSGKLGELLKQSELYFYFEANPKSIKQEQRFSILTFDWLSKIKNPSVGTVLQYNNFPLVISGGDYLDKIVIDEIYKKYALKAPVIPNETYYEFKSCLNSEVINEP